MIDIPPIDIEKIAEQIREQRPAVEEELRRIGESKRVSWETMRLAVG